MGCNVICNVFQSEIKVSYQFKHCHDICMMYVQNFGRKISFLNQTSAIVYIVLFINIIYLLIKDKLKITCPTTFVQIL